MSKFKKGDIVRVIKGWNEGVEGTVTNPYFQIAANDWPFVLFDDTEGDRHSADESDMILVEDPTCEYAMLCSYRDKEGANPIQNDEWTTKAEAEETLHLFTTGEGGECYKDRFIFTLVKRRKAGKVEVV